MTTVVPFPVSQPREGNVRPNDSRGEMIRATLMEIVLECAANDAPLPKYHAIGADIGIGQSQVARHFGRLMDAGAFNTQQRGRSVYIAELLHRWVDPSTGRMRDLTIGAAANARNDTAGVVCG